MLRTFIWLTLFSAAAFAQEVAVIVHKWDNSVGFYDPNSGERLARVEIGVKPHEMALSADRRLAYITNYGVNSYTQQEEGGNSISILDLVRREKLGEIDLGKFHRPHGIELGRNSEGIGIDPSGLFGYVSAQGDNKVIKFSLKDWRPLLEIKTAARPDPIAIIKIPPSTKR